MKHVLSKTLVFQSEHSQVDRFSFLLGLVVIWTLLLSVTNNTQQAFV